MKYLFIILALIAVLSVITNLPLKTITPTNLETKTASEGGITIAVTPQMLGEGEFSFRLTLDTHAGELDTDLTQVSTLIDDQSRIYKPSGWEGDPPGGHHREGILTFGQIAPIPQTLRLTIRQIGGVPERQFLWITNP
ncbi:MAG: hypothetical protein HY481_01840 [Candidatus Vogelbacteria bacterium]|nr:hypothetical protein [Candidatus Vogelbacteria bacterium]